VPVDELSATFSALADPTRRAILTRLADEGEATVSELAEPFPISVQAVSKHLGVLERAGLIERGRRAQQRPARLAASGRLWQASFDRLEWRLRD
jgi:DNA-binding transcriptional ArsR family regulator